MSILSRRTFAALAPAALAVALLPLAAVAQQAFPTKPVTIVVPYAPGGVTDAWSRLVGAKMEKSLGQTVIVENRAGAAGAIGSQYVAKSAPDGYTLVAFGTSSHAVAPVVVPDLPFVPTRDFVAVAITNEQPMFLGVASNLGVSDVKSFVALLKAKKGELNFGTAGANTGSHISAVRFLQVTGTEAQDVQYRGTGSAITDLVAGRNAFQFDALSTLVPHHKAGAIKIIGVLANQRWPQLPEVPTFTEAGFPDLMKGQWEYWQGIAAPAGTPKPALDRLNAAINDALRDPEVAERFAGFGLRPHISDQATAQARFINDSATIATALKTMGFVK